MADHEEEETEMAEIEIDIAEWKKLKVSSDYQPSLGIRTSRLT